MSSRPLVSVCIPSYNGAPFIGRTLQSVLNQTFKDFEVVVSDDLSTDDTPLIVQSFKDPRIRLVRNHVNLGMGGNWNRVLSLGLGRYVKLLCNDDLLHPQCLERQIGALERPGNVGVSLAVCNREVINDRDEVVLRGRSRTAGIMKGPELIRTSIRLGTNIIGEPAVGLFRREAMRKAEMCDPANPFLSDLSLWSELLKWGDVFIDPGHLAGFRISHTAASSKIGLAQASCFRAFALKLRQDPFYRLSRFDLVSGALLSLPLCVMRNIFVSVRTADPRPRYKPTATEAQVASTEVIAGSHPSSRQRCRSSASLLPKVPA